MPFPSRTTYDKLLKRLFAHWSGANEFLPLSEPLLLRNPQGRLIRAEDIPDLQVSLHSCLELLADAMEAATEAFLELDSGKRAALFRAQAAVRSLPRKPAGARAPITYPSIHDPWTGFVRSLEHIASAWAAFDQHTGRPLLLPGKYRQQDFEAEIGHLKKIAAYASRASDKERSLRKKYDALFSILPPLFPTYAAEIRRRFPAGSPYHLDIPLPPSGDVFVIPPTASQGIWLPRKSAALITWEPATEPQPHFYEVRCSPGSRYDPAVEFVVGTVPSGQPAMLLATRRNHRHMPCLYRVYTVLVSLADAGGEIVTVLPDSGEDRLPDQIPAP